MMDEGVCIGFIAFVLVSQYKRGIVYFSPISVQCFFFFLLSVFHELLVGEKNRNKNPIVNFIVHFVLYFASSFR